MIGFIKEICKFWFSAEFFAVGMFAFGGVAIRVGLQNAFSGSGVNDPSTGYGPFMQMFYTQSYLLPNFLGCFIMSFCIVNTKYLSDTSLPLFKGLSTGFCGSITTFSTWMNVSVGSLFGPSDWIRILTMIMLEFWLTWSAFNMGHAAAKVLQQLTWKDIVENNIYRFFVVFFCCCSGKSNIPTRSISGANGTELTADCQPSADKAAKEGVDCTKTAAIGSTSSGLRFSGHGRRSDLQLQQQRNSNLMVANDEDAVLHEVSGRISIWREDGNVEVDLKLLDVDNDDPRFSDLLDDQLHKLQFLSLSAASPLYQKRQSLSEKQKQRWSLSTSTVSSGKRTGTGREGCIESPLQAIEEASYKNSTPNSPINRTPSEALTISTLITGAPTPHELKSSAAQESFAPPTDTVAAPPPAKKVTFWQCCKENEYYLWATLFCITSSGIWMILIFESQFQYFDNMTVRDTYRSVALAPLGAWLRWSFTRFPQIKASWPEMNPQTILANLTAVVFECILLVFASSSWVTAINNGENVQ